MTKRIYKKRPRKPGSTWGHLSEKIIAAITDLGPMTRAELCQHLSRDSESVSSVLARLRRPTKELPKRLYISGWVYDQEGMRGYPRAQYSLGTEPDKARRKDIGVKRLRSMRDAMKTERLKNASVFHLGMTRNELRERSRQIREMYGEAA